MDDPPQLPLVEAKLPPRVPVQGTHVLLRPLQPSDADDLYLATINPSLWRFMPDGPYPTLTSFSASIATKSTSTDPLFFAVIDPATGTPVGHVTFMRISLPHRTIEIGYIIFSDSVHRSPLTTETIYLMLRTIFEDLGYRRCEWKCDDRNEPSKAAARRFGFVFEGVFRQHYIVKGRNRDTAWFAIVDGEWPRVKRGFERWLDAGNFDEGGRQRKKLVECRDE